MGPIPKQLQTLLDRARTRQFPRGFILCTKGDSVTEVYVLQSGAVKIFDSNDRGSEKILHILKPPSIIPFAFFTGEDAKVHWNYAALTACEVSMLDPRELREVMHKDGTLASYLIRQFSRETHELLVHVSSLSKSKAREKLLATLRFLLVHHGEELGRGWWVIPFSATNQFLADISGITRESASVIMKELQDAGLVRGSVPSNLEIHRDKLLEVAESA